jgi:capsular polysaccharide biosynthesis protein
MEINNSNVVEINIKEIFYMLLRKLWIIILVTILCAVGSGLYSIYYIEPYYTSSAKLYIINRQPGDITTLSDLQTGSSLAKDYMILVKSRPVTDEVIRILKLKMSNAALAGSISVFTPTDTRVLQISVNHPDPDMAKLLVDTISEVSTERMVSIMGMEKVNIVEEGNYPFAPSSPNIRKNIMLAGSIGALMTAGILVLIYLLNDSIKTAEDIEKFLGLTTLGFIPIEENIKNKKSKQKQRKIKAA